MSARIPIGWSPCVPGCRPNEGALIEVLTESGVRMYDAFGRHWRLNDLAWRLIEAQRPPLEYPAATEGGAE